MVSSKKEFHLSLLNQWVAVHWAMGSKPLHIHPHSQSRLLEKTSKDFSIMTVLNQWAWCWHWMGWETASAFESCHHKQREGKAKLQAKNGKSTGESTEAGMNVLTKEWAKPTKPLGTSAKSLQRVKKEMQNWANEQNNWRCSKNCFQTGFTWRSTKVKVCHVAFWTDSFCFNCVESDQRMDWLAAGHFFLVDQTGFKIIKPQSEFFNKTQVRWIHFYYFSLLLPKFAAPKWCEVTESVSWSLHLTPLDLDHSPHRIGTNKIRISEFLFSPCLVIKLGTEW